MTRARAPATALRVAPEFVAEFAAAGIETVADLFARSECVRDLPDRSNHVLRVGPRSVHVKRTKGAVESAEAVAIARARAVGVSTATIVCQGSSPEEGALVGTLDLAPARPLDALLTGGALDPSQRSRVSTALADAVARLHRARLFPRDLYLNHVFVDPGDAAGAVTLIDLERMMEPRWLVRRAIVRDLAALRASTPDDCVSGIERRHFLAAYLVARGLDPRASIDALARAVRRKAAAIRAHVPRTPVGDAARPARPLP